MEAVITDHCRRWNTVNACAGSKCFNIAPTCTRGVTRHNRLPCFRLLSQCPHSHSHSQQPSPLLSFHRPMPLSKCFRRGCKRQRTPFFHQLWQLQPNQMVMMEGSARFLQDRFSSIALWTLWMHG